MKRTLSGLEWFRKYHYPLGKAIGYHDVTYVTMKNGMLREISKHFDGCAPPTSPTDGFKFYAFTRQRFTDDYEYPADRWVFRSRSLEKTLAALENDSKPMK